MLVTREELLFDFGGAELDPTQEQDRRFLVWVLNQFLYGEVTGIQCGYWMYRAPHLKAARFLAKQASEEFSHVRKFLRIFSLLGETPGPAHPAVRFLTTGMMGGNWGEHVALEMAIGEGLVLTVFYALCDTIRNPEIRRILETSCAEEESHVDFGERETLEWIRRYPHAKPILLGSALLQILALRWLRGFILNRIGLPTNPVLRRFPEFYDHVLRTLELRLLRLGLLDRPLSEMSSLRHASLLFLLPLRKVAFRFFLKERLLTETYLEDPLVREEAGRLV
jgi:hypothetical protein